jgi:hypothetical protein
MAENAKMEEITMNGKLYDSGHSSLSNGFKRIGAVSL